MGGVSEMNAVPHSSPMYLMNRRELEACTISVGAMKESIEK
jgi:hypothetical protein